ncbi:hypothetical protein B0T21DRAFT_200272 [Apiosordaria backusii]|uniref:Uncharacterized protein n=1 Tax=Apiosordaria backusii TaxID=314023 RepID=A0AA40ECU3_9PEZI|nr:hypothetical protein B0T21DRAFT_200272 [Apiosordaria backusii]
MYRAEGADIRKALIFHLTCLFLKTGSCRQLHGFLRRDSHSNRALTRTIPEVIKIPARPIHPTTASHIHEQFTGIFSSQSSALGNHRVGRHPHQLNLPSTIPHHALPYLLYGFKSRSKARGGEEKKKKRTV